MLVAKKQDRPPPRRLFRIELKREGDAGKLLESAMTRATTAFKVAWKRTVDVSKVSLLRQLIFGLTAAKYVLAATEDDSVAADDLMKTLEESYPCVLEVVPEEHRNQIKATPQVVAKLAAELVVATSAGEMDEVADAVSLETVRDTLAAALAEESGGDEGEKTVGHVEPMGDPLEAVFAMVHGILINMRFPLGATGKPNFADVWSAMIDKHSFDVVSAQSAIRLFKRDGKVCIEGSEEAVAVGVTDRRGYNGFVPLMDKGDPLETTVLRIFSGLQVMNLLQMTVLAGSPGGCLPNTWPGVVAATLARVIRMSTGGEWSGREHATGEPNDRLAAQMVYYLRGIMGAPAKGSRLRLRAGKADPSNPVSKFLMVLCKHPRATAEDEASFHEKMSLVLNEWVAATIQLYFGNACSGNDAKYHAFLQDIIPLETLFGADALDVKPLEKIHPLERLGGVKAAAISVLGGWKSAASKKLSETSLYEELKRLIDRCRVVFSCTSMAYDLDAIAFDYVVYRFRTVRYKFIQAPSPTSAATDGSRASGADAGRGEKGTHEPLSEMPPTLELLLEVYRKALRSELAARKDARREHAIDDLKARTISTRRITSQSSTYSLSRNDVPSILAVAGYGDLAFVEELILGSWTPEPPQCLRRFSADIIFKVNAAGGGGEGGLAERLCDAISQAFLCNRTWKSNRHGHSATLRYPGPMGWPAAYETARRDNRLATGRGPLRILPQMRRYRDFGYAVLGRADKLASGNRDLRDLRSDVRAVLYSFEDANRLPAARAGIDKLGVKPLLDDL